MSDRDRPDRDDDRDTPHRYVPGSDDDDGPCTICGLGKSYAIHNWP